MMTWAGRTSVGMSVALVLMAQAHAERISRAAPGTAPCPGDKAVRVLVIGGEMQPNSWCNGASSSSESRRYVNEKRKREREEYKRKQEEERARRKREHDCRGVGKGANCTEANPGKGKASGRR